MTLQCSSGEPLPHVWFVVPLPCLWAGTRGPAEESSGEPLPQVRVVVPLPCLWAGTSAHPVRALLLRPLHLHRCVARVWHLDTQEAPWCGSWSTFPSASACAREDRHVGGTRWADASDIHSDAESIRIPLLVCHRVIWDPGYLVERDCYMRAARNLGYSRLQFRTLLASPLTSLSPEHPNNQFVGS